MKKCSSVIIIRVNVSKAVGTGHFRRMNVLSRLFKEKVLFLVNTDDLSNRLFDSSKNIFFTTDRDELLDFQALIDKFNVDLIILDLLNYSKNYIKILKKISKCKIVSFHEYNDYSKSSDLSFNCNFIKKNRVVIDNEVLYGKKYIILKDEIAKFKNLNEKDFIYINFGGSDPSKFTEKFIFADKKYKIKENFILDIGLFKNDKLLELPKNYKLRKKNQNIYKIMAQAKMNILAAGNIMYESIYLKKKSFILAHNFHQKKFALEAEKKGFIKYYGMGSNLDFEKLLINIKSKNLTKVTPKSSFLDINGTKRIHKKIKSLI